MTKQQINYLLENSITAALKAGKEIINIYEADDFSVEMKSDNSPLTKADKTSHKIINDNLIKEIDGESIELLSEEGKNIPYDERKNWKLYWLIDPLDGTKEFIKRNGEFTVNIALIENNEPILGVIYAPVYGAKEKDKSKKDEDQAVIFTHHSESGGGTASARPDGSSIGEPESNLSDGGILKQAQNDNNVNNSIIRQFEKFGNFDGTLYFAAKNIGAFKASYHNNNILGESLAAHSKLINLHDDRKVQNSRLIAVGSRSHSSDEEKNKLQELGVEETISVGSSLKFCMVSEGKAQVYYRHGPTMEWDVAAGYIIAKEAGAKIEGLQFNKQNLLNSSFLVTLRTF